MCESSPEVRVQKCEVQAGFPMARLRCQGLFRENLSVGSATWRRSSQDLEMSSQAPTHTQTWLALSEGQHSLCILLSRKILVHLYKRNSTYGRN